MTLLTAFEALHTNILTMREEFSGLRMTIREDKPLASVVFEDTFGDVIDELLGKVEEGLITAEEGQQAVEQQIDLDRAWRALTTCQDRFNALEYCFFELVSFEGLAPLLRFGRQQGGEWQAWTSSVKEGLERCWQPIYEVNQALFQCWQEIAEQAGVTSVSMRATNIGQQIMVPESKILAQEGIP